MPMPDVIAFVMRGCGACTEYMPRFRKVARPYARSLGIAVIDVDDPRAQKLADFYGIRATPTTVLPKLGKKAEGALGDAQIAQMLALAATGRRR